MPTYIIFQLTILSLAVTASQAGVVPAYGGHGVGLGYSGYDAGYAGYGGHGGALVGGHGGAILGGHGGAILATAAHHDPLEGVDYYVSILR